MAESETYAHLEHPADAGQVEAGASRAARTTAGVALKRVRTLGRSGLHCRGVVFGFWWSGCPWAWWCVVTFGLVVVVVAGVGGFTPNACDGVPTT